MLEILEDDWLLFLIGQYPHGARRWPRDDAVHGRGWSVSQLPRRNWRLRWHVSVRVVGFADRRTAMVYVVRGLPLIMFIFWTYFALPLLTGHTVGGVETLLFALVVYEASYLSEIIRAGIEGLPKGQAEAAKALGLGYCSDHLQGHPAASPAQHDAKHGQPVRLHHQETSLGYVISANEMTFAASQVNNQLMTPTVRGVWLARADVFRALLHPDIGGALAGTPAGRRARWARRSTGVRAP